MRILFKNKEDRELFFNQVKSNLNLSWKDIGRQFNVPKASFERYRSGKLSTPEELYNKLKDFSNLEIDDSNIYVLEDNLGQIKGGKKAYKINKTKFDEGRLLGSKSIKKKREIEEIIFKLELNKDICELAGTFIGDGCFNVYNNKLYHIEFSGDTRYDLPYYEEIIIPILKSIIPDIKPHFYYGHNRDNSLRVVFYSKKIFIFMKDFLGFTPGKKTFTIKIPDKIILAGDEFIRSTIRGIFDTDGCVFLDRRKKYKNPYPRIFLQTVSKPLYDQLYPYLSREFKMYTRFNEKRQIYIMEIYGLEQVRKWMNIIGFSNNRHLSKIYQIAPVAQR